ncbi:hypothetical protein B6A42_26870 (plasmid) [Vibrio coralliilyticus]|nr:hypothetical protein B6A42_26870 [Vibrio coralliilyticus]
MSTEVSLNIKFFNQFFKRDILILLPIDLVLMNVFNELVKSLVWFDGYSVDLRVDEQTDQIFCLRIMPIGNRRSCYHIALIREFAEQH